MQIDNTPLCDEPWKRGECMSSLHPGEPRKGAVLWGCPGGVPKDCIKLKDFRVSGRFGGGWSGVLGIGRGICRDRNVVGLPWDPCRGRGGKAQE